MAAIKLMTIKNIDTRYGLDSRSVYASHMLNEGFADVHETYDAAVFFELAKAYLAEIDESVNSFEHAAIDKVIG